MSADSVVPRSGAQAFAVRFVPSGPGGLERRFGRKQGR